MRQLFWDGAVSSPSFGVVLCRGCLGCVFGVALGGGCFGVVLLCCAVVRCPPLVLLCCVGRFGWVKVFIIMY